MFKAAHVDYFACSRLDPGAGVPLCPFVPYSIISVSGFQKEGTGACLQQPIETPQG